MKSTGANGAAPGGHADVAEGDKYTQYGKQYVGLNADSSPALAILAMERHGSFSKGTLEYWKAAVHVAHERQKTSEFPVHLSVLTRRVFQTLRAGRRPVARQREPHLAVPPPGVRWRPACGERLRRRPLRSH